VTLLELTRLILHRQVVTYEEPVGTHEEPVGTQITHVEQEAWEPGLETRERIVLETVESPVRIFTTTTSTGEEYDEVEYEPVQVERIVQEEVQVERLVTRMVPVERPVTREVTGLFFPCMRMHTY
jgi:hypothetical protein